LYYILVKRLLEQQPTILQISPEYLFIFSSSGFNAITLSKFAHPKPEEYQRAWALVDINSDVEKPAEMLRRTSSPFFLIMSSPPRASRLEEVQRYRAPVAFWFMNPFSLAELIQASVYFLARISSCYLYDIPVVNSKKSFTTSQISTDTAMFHPSPFLPTKPSPN
jgi:hypothetical protein